MATPIEVVLLQLKYIIIIPLSSLGTGTGKFMNGLWTQLPFPFNLIIFPMTLLLLLIFVPAVMTIINGQSFKINIMHLFHVQFGNQNESVHQINELAQLLSMNPRFSRIHSSLPSTTKVKKNNEKKNNGKNKRWFKNFKSGGQEKHFKSIKSNIKDEAC